MRLGLADPYRTLREQAREMIIIRACPVCQCEIIIKIDPILYLEYKEAGLDPVGKCPNEKSHRNSSGSRIVVHP